MAPLFATTAQGAGRGWFLARIIEVEPGERIRIGPELKGVGGPGRIPGGWPGKPQPPKPPHKMPDDLNKHWGALASWSQEFYARVWSFFDFFCTFTADGEVVKEDVKVTDAFSQIVEDLGRPRADGAQPKHISGGFNQADLQNALNDAVHGTDEDDGEGERDESTIEEGKEPPKDVFWNDLEDIIVKPKPGDEGKPPAPGEGDSEDEKKKKEEVKKAIEAIKPGKLDAEVKIKNKERPK